MTDNLGKTSTHANTGEFALRVDAPVLELDFGNWSGADNQYPGVWITVPVEDEDGNYAGRTYVTVYPSADEPDPDGFVALNYGGRYYDEGMSCSDAADHEKRIDCFKAAELLYLHAADKGNPYAYLCLGYVYSYNRCEGDFFRDMRHEEALKDCTQPYPREQRAFECLKVAAEAGIAEGCYKLGDMYKHGMGCEPDAAAAFACYKRAFELGKHDEPVIWGSVALRLGDAFENGFGCEQSFEQAHKWYAQAATGLEIAVNAGEWYYERALAGARAGLKRVAQELA